ncbi:hypothetical protein HDV02_004245 [Globomyces sp. JEL0801]|nr:hypothetical protein HDV02_004245 [Globomyces sp. JEL0801]
MTYILSTTDIKLHSLLIGTIGLLPGITLHVLVGALTRSANNSKTPLRVSLLTGVIGFSFALLAFVCITCVARRALRSVVHLDTAEEEVDVQSIDLLNDSGSIQSNRLEMGALDNISSLNDSVCDTEVIDTSANGDISSNQVMEDSSSMKDNSIPFETQSTVVLENSSCCSITQSSTTQISPALNPTINATKKCSIDIEQDQSNCLVQNNQLEQPLPNNTHENTHSTLILQQTDSQPVKIRNNIFSAYLLDAVFTTGEKIAMMVVSCISFLALTIGIPVILLNTTPTGTTWGNP